MTEKDVLTLVGIAFAAFGFLVMVFAARRLRGAVLFVIWIITTILFGLSAELHMLSESANSWDFAFAVTYQSIPLVLGGTIGVVYGIFTRDKA